MIAGPCSCVKQHADDERPAVKQHIFNALIGIYNYSMKKIYEIFS
jgi:hypothetical protein